jgi:hypothetical protein
MKIQVALAAAAALLAFGTRAFADDVDQKSMFEYVKRIEARGHQWRIKDDSCAAGIAAYKDSVHALVRTHCTHCHGDNPDIKHALQFALEDPAASRSAVERLVNWDDYQHSFFITQGGNGHCVPNGYDCQTGPADLIAAVDAWWKNGESTCPRLGKFFTDPAPLPAGLPVGTQNWVPMRWDLSGIDPSLDGAIFEVEVQQFAAPSDTTPGAYRFRKPRLATVLNPVHIKGIRVLVNGKFDSYADEYVPVEVTVGSQAIPADPTKPLPHPVLSADPLIVTEDKPAGDQISVGFEDLTAVAKQPVCKALPLYQKSVLPTIKARNCYYCHSGGDQGLPGDDSHGAVSRLSFAGTDAALCARLVQRVTAWNPEISPLISYPLKGSYGHAHVIPSVEEVSPGWLDWITAETAP